MDIYELFTAEQIAVSPIDPRGVVKLGWPVARIPKRSCRRADRRRGPLQQQRPKALIAKAIRDSSHFYTLSYIPTTQK